VRCCENLPYVFKGAQCAPGGAPAVGAGRRATDPLMVRRRSVRPQLAGHREPLLAGCRLPSFGLSATSAPAGTQSRGRPRGPGAATSAVAHRLQTGPSLQRLHPEALRARGQERSRRCAIPSGLWTAAPQGFRGAYRRDGQD